MMPRRACTSSARATIHLRWDGGRSRIRLGGVLGKSTRAAYVYADDAPVMLTDPSGRAAITNQQIADCIGSVIAAGGVAIGSDLAIDGALELGSLGLLTPVVIIALIIETIINAGILLVAVAEKCPFLFN